MQSPLDARTTLPLELTSFIGRERETAELCQLVSASRLLTLTGAGGSGKTRLALQVVRALNTDAQRDVVWVELAALNDSAHIASHVARACGISEEIRGDAALLASLLQERSLILVLDNCEHLVDACAELADVLLRFCPELSILATSREALGVKGERAWLVPALPADDASTLFIERAREFAGAFEPAGEKLAVVTEICARLDGIPLAIELAAARIKVLTPEQIRDRLDDAFALLKSRARGLVTRHRTLQAAMDWSYDLLSDDERVMLQRLAVFRGGFTLDAVEAIAPGGSIDSSAVIDLLARLVDRSLVVVREQAAAARYSLLETVRQYARQKLDASAEEQPAYARHAVYFSTLAAEAEPFLIRRERPIWLERLSADIDNIREALEWSRQHQPALHIRLAGMLWWFWFSTRYWTEAGRVLNDALALPEAADTTRERAKLLFAAGALAALQAKPAAARPLLEEAADIATALEDRQLLAYARNYLGMAYAGETRAESRELCRAAAAWFEENNDPYGHRLALLLLASLAVGQGAYDESAALSAKAVEIARAFGQPRELAIALQTHALPYVYRRDFAYARRALIECLQANRKDPSYFSIAIALDCLADINAHESHPLVAARLLGAADHLRSAIGAVRFKFQESHINGVIAELRAAAGEAEFARAFAEGRQLSAEQVLNEVLSAEVVAPAPAQAAAPIQVSGRAGSALRVFALGPLQVEIEGAALPAAVWRYTKPRELLVYLLLHRAGSTRDRIARALWPAATPAQLKNSFHVTLHHLRKVLGHAEWIVVESDRYRLDAKLAHEFDADRFENAVQKALRSRSSGLDVDRLRTALELYRGDLLDGEVKDDWIEEHSSRLSRLYLTGALALGDALENAGQGDEAVALYEQMIARDQLQEEAHRRLIAHWTRLGDRARAVRHYTRLTAVLRSVLDAKPERATVELYERILSADA